MQKKIYIAGKVSGLPKEEYTAAFEAAEGVVTRMGHIPLSPIKLCAHLDAKPNATWEDYMNVCINVILFEADQVLLLHNWEDSRGARIECHIAKARGLHIISGHPLPDTIKI